MLSCWEEHRVEEVNYYNTYGGARVTAGRAHVCVAADGDKSGKTTITDVL